MDKTAQHTPGPWKADTHAGCRTIKGGKCGTARQAQYKEIAFTVGLHDDTEDDGNACLIASAPDLLAERDRLRAVNAELMKLAEQVIAWYENAGNADPVQSSAGSVELWKHARAFLAALDQDKPHG